MFCIRCGAENPPLAPRCVHCGVSLQATSVSDVQPFTADTAKNDPLAIASLVLGILGIWPLSIFAGIPAVILGQKARRRIRESAGMRKGAGLAKAGLILGYISISFLFILFLFFMMIGLYSR